MDKIQKEVERHARKKEQLNLSFLERMNRLISSKRKRIEQTTNVVSELNQLIESDVSDVKRAEEAIKQA